MNACKEFALDDVFAIVAIPVSNISAGDLMSPVNILTPTIDRSAVTTEMLTDAVTLGLQPVLEGGVLIPIIRNSGKAKDDESDSVAGRLHSVTVKCEADDRDSETWDHLRLLERTPSHLLLTYRDGSRAFVSATQDTYLCTVERSGSNTSVSFKIQNLIGMQLLV